jgi:hypothetical protein
MAHKDALQGVHALLAGVRQGEAFRKAQGIILGGDEALFVSGYRGALELLRDDLERKGRL